MQFTKVFRLSLLLAFAAIMPAKAESLNSVLARVYESNPEIRAERARQRATNEATFQAWASAVPQINGSLGYSRVDETQTVNSTFFGESTTTTDRFKLNTKTASIAAEQTIFDGFRNINTIKLARARVRAGEAQLILLEQDILLSAVTAFFDIQRDTTVYDANVANVEVLVQQLREAKLRFDFGEITQTDVRQAEARLAGAQAQLAAARTQLAISRAAFREVVGDTPGELDGDTASPPLPPDEQAAQDYAFNAAPSLIAARFDEEASRKQVLVENGSLAPRIALTASYNYSEEPSSFVVEDEQFIYGVRATMPLFQGGLRFSRSREAKALNARDKSRIVAAERRVRSQVTAAWRQLIEAQMRIVAVKSQVEANEFALRGVRREAQVGSRTTLDVLNAEQELLNSNVSLATAQRDEQVAAHRVLAVIGALTPDQGQLSLLEAGWSTIEAPAE